MLFLLAGAWHNIYEIKSNLGFWLMGYTKQLLMPHIAEAYTFKP